MSDSEQLGDLPDEIDLLEEQRAEIERLADLARTGTHYELLDVAENADAKTVQKAYYDLSRQWHPDRFFRKELGEYGPMLESVFIAIADAYRVLSDDARRTVYDMERAGKGFRPQRRVPPPPEPRRTTEPPADAPVYEAQLPRRGAQTDSTRTTSSVRSRADGHSRSDPDTSSSGSSSAREQQRSRRRAFRNKGLAKVRDEVVGRLKRARQCYEEGKAELEAGNFVKASASLALAVSFDPQNADYARLNAQAQREARRAQMQMLVTQAEHAETYRNIRGAIVTWRKVVSYEPDDGMPYFRLGKLIWKFDDDLRTAVQYLRQAVQQSPKVVEYRMLLGDAYVDLDLKLNARREYQAVLDMDKTHAGAKEGLKKAR